VQEELKGTVERITYYSEEDGYTVARFQPEGRSDLVTVVGNLMSVNVGASLRLEGFWTTHPKHGRQFKVINYHMGQVLDSGYEHNNPMYERWLELISEKEIPTRLARAGMGIGTRPS